MVHNKASYESSLANLYLEQINFPSGGDELHLSRQLCLAAQWRVSRQSVASTLSVS